MHSRQQIIQRRKACRHAGNPSLQAAQLFNTGIGVIQHLFDRYQRFTAGAVHHNIKNRLFRMVQRFLQGILLAVALLRNLIGGMNQLTKRRLFPNQTNVRLHIGGGRHILAQFNQISRAAYTFQRTASAQLCVYRHKVHWALIPMQLQHSAVNLLVSGGIEVLVLQILRRLKYCGVILKHGAQHTALRF